MEEVALVLYHCRERLMCTRSVSERLNFCLQTIFSYLSWKVGASIIIELVLRSGGNEVLAGM